MDFQNIQTVKELTHALKQYNQNLVTTIFDDKQGYISVAFKKDKIEKNGNDFKFLCFYPNYEVALYPVETLLSYLKKLPEQATIAIKDPDGNYSSLYLTIDETIDKGTQYKWLVISDKLSYERFFLTNTLTAQEQALEKMLKELETEHDDTIEYIHNWLCKQNDEPLFQGILKEDRTIKGAITYCMGKAQEQAKDQSSTMVADEVVFRWVKEFFLLEKLPETKAVGKVTTTGKKKTIKKEEPKPQRKEVDEQIKLFEL
ncbi:Cas9 inhibitor AcrIIA9 family protein (plasmid) [Enterococcus faecalis]|uniref:Cas9 inhibitor AcrIIA9 family protein n=1 Tax=Enterococcus faecalis TaxID=1351 RepID=UPI0029C8491E|nr:Cas9 inhibitor AcrIIA9 family protein [Enterococcus faecalis]WPH48384.1 Cas9 inhibitor AcrIIA9 family protein [Enterococcus faecalis]